MLPSYKYAIIFKTIIKTKLRTDWIKIRIKTRIKDNKMQLTIEHKSRLIPFQIEYRKRRTMEIRIQPPDNIKVLVPAGLSKDIIIREVKGKADWICKKLEEYHGVEYKVIKKAYMDGETFLYLGSSYQLRIIETKYKTPRVNLLQDTVCIYTSTRDEDELKNALEKWYRLRMKEVIAERIRYYQQFFKMTPSGIVIKEQKKRWGSCTSERKLLFNWRLVMAPVSVIDYVVVHEMCHMKHMNHSKDFWNLVEVILPDYKERKKWLKLNGIMLDYK
ncbi:MAG: hypothetical protein K0R92_1245 [Lachnospiraceae bacterium]|nr:hypothetical protein [Lachnospiraceae bacterium]